MATRVDPQQIRAALTGKEIEGGPTDSIEFLRRGEVGVLLAEGERLHWTEKKSIEGAGGRVEEVRVGTGSSGRSLVLVAWEEPGSPFASPEEGKQEPPLCSLCGEPFHLGTCAESERARENGREVEPLFDPQDEAKEAFEAASRAAAGIGKEARDVFEDPDPTPTSPLVAVALCKRCLGTEKSCVCEKGPKFEGSVEFSVAAALRRIGAEDPEAQLLAHQLLLCAGALDALAQNPNVYPPGTVAHRALQAKKTLERTAAGRKILAGTEAT